MFVITCNLYTRTALCKVEGSGSYPFHINKPHITILAYLHFNSLANFRRMCYCAMTCTWTVSSLHR